MKNLFGKIFFVTVLAFLVQIFSSSVTLAKDPPRGIPAGGKGATEVAAIEDMKLSTIKRVLAQITERNEDPDSPYQQLLKRYGEFVDKIHVEKKSKNPSGAIVVTGRVEIKYNELQAELGRLVKAAHKDDQDTRAVYVFVRFAADGATDTQIIRAEKAILSRYMTRLEENKFIVERADEILGQLNQTRSMSFDQFVEFVKKESLTSEVSTAIVGEIVMAKEEEDSDGFTVSCEINIRALDCIDNFKIIDNYEGSDILRLKKDVKRDERLRFMFEKAAVTSSKSITDSLVKYWTNK